MASTPHPSYTAFEWGIRRGSPLRIHTRSHLNAEFEPGSNHIQGPNPIQTRSACGVLIYIYIQQPTRKLGGVNFFLFLSFFALYHKTKKHIPPLPVLLGLRPKHAKARENGAQQHLSSSKCPAGFLVLFRRARGVICYLFHVICSSPPTGSHLSFN